MSYPLRRARAPFGAKRALHGVPRMPMAHPIAILCASMVTTMWAGHAHAQANAGYTSSVATAYCTSLITQARARDASPPPGCASVFATPTSAAEFAPDRFVMQSSAAVAMAERAFGIVDRRLRDLRDEQQRLSRASPLTRLAGAGSGLDGNWLNLPIVLAQASTSMEAGTSSGTIVDSDAPAAGPLTAGLRAASRNPLAVYLRAEGSRQNADATTRDPGFKSDHGAFTLGGDYSLSAKTVFGGALSIDESRSTLDDLNTAPLGHLNTRGTALSLYGAFYPTDQSYVDGSLLWGHNRYSTVRRMPSVNESAVGDTNGHEYGFDVGAGYDFNAGQVTYGPYARLAYTHIVIDAFSEQPNATSTALSIAEQSVNSMLSTLGVQWSDALSQSWGVLVPNARIEWAHQYKDDRTRALFGAFTNDASGTTMEIDPTRADRNYFNLGLGLAAHMGVGRSAFIYYQTDIARSNQRNQVLSAELRLEF